MRTSSIATALLVLCGGTAYAQAPAPEAPVVDATVHNHDGFYLRIGTGFGSYNETITMEDADDSSTVTGMASVGELSFGGAVRPGFIVGGGFWTSSVMASDLQVRGPAPPDEVMVGGGNYTVVGPFIDWYFDPRGGLHLQGAIGLATVRGWNLTEADVYPDAASIGAGVMVGFGYEWWASAQWSLGILGRLTGVIAAQETEDDVLWFHAIGSSPSVLFTATYN